MTKICYYFVRRCKLFSHEKDVDKPVSEKKNVVKEDNRAGKSLSDSLLALTLKKLKLL